MHLWDKASEDFFLSKYSIHLLNYSTNHCPFRNTTNIQPNWMHLCARRRSLSVFCKGPPQPLLAKMAQSCSPMAGLPRHQMRHTFIFTSSSSSTFQPIICVTTTISTPIHLVREFSSRHMKLPLGLLLSYLPAIALQCRRPSEVVVEAESSIQVIIFLPPSRSTHPSRQSGSRAALECT